MYTQSCTYIMVTYLNQGKKKVSLSSEPFNSPKWIILRTPLQRLGRVYFFPAMFMYDTLTIYHDEMSITRLVRTYTFPLYFPILIIPAKGASIQYIHFC